MLFRSPSYAYAKKGYENLKAIVDKLDARGAKAA